MDVKRTQKYGVTPAEMWERIGDFHGLHKWHPHVAETEVREANVRALTLQNGRTTVETKIDEGELYHSYRIDESDLPVKNFEATLLVRESGEGGDGSEIVWTAQFDAHGAEDADAAEIVEGVFEAVYAASRKRRSGSRDDPLRAPGVQNQPAHLIDFVISQHLPNLVGFADAERRVFVDRVGVGQKHQRR